MTRPTRTALVLMLTSVVALSGCYPSHPMYLHEPNDLSYFLDTATDISYPDVHAASLEETTNSKRPRTISNPDSIQHWDLTLEDVVSMALQNSKIIRGTGTPGLQGNLVAAGVDSLTQTTRGAGTVYDVAVRESEPGGLNFPGQVSPTGNIVSNTQLESNQGVEAALAEFDAQFSTSMFWDRTDRPRNTLSTNPFVPVTFQEDRVTFSAELSKKAATGTQLFFRNTTEYVNNNVPAAFQPLGSVYTTALEMEVRQPLLRGRGTMINRMPVIIARIGTDQELATLEANLQNMICNLEIRYWDLHCAFRQFETSVNARDAALETWQRLSAEHKEGKTGIRDLSQAQEQYMRFKGDVQRAFANLVDAESNLRWLMGLATTDERLIRPSDDPNMALVDFDWGEIHTESLVRRPVLRQERWEIKKKELQLAYARNSLLPQVNAVGLYRWLGLGDELIAANRSGINFPGVGSRAWEELTEGNYQEVRLGLEFAAPVGFRRELSNVRNAQLKLARQRALMEDLELDVVRELSLVYRAVDTNYQLAQTNLNRWQAAEAEVQYFEDVEKVGGFRDVNLKLQAQQRRAQAQADFYSSLCEYNKSIALMHRRKGTTLDYCGVQFGEGPWPEKAYFDAVGHARRRSASRHLDYGWTRPGVISTGSNQAHGTVTHEILQGDLEQVPATSPTPADPNTKPAEAGNPPAVPDATASHEQIAPASHTVAVTPQPAVRQPQRIDPAHVSLRPIKPATQTAPQPATSQQARPSTPPSAQPSIQWERMGLTSPGKQSEKTRAVIRQTNSDQ